MDRLFGEARGLSFAYQTGRGEQIAIYGLLALALPPVAGVGLRFFLGLSALLEQVPASLFTVRSTIRTSDSTSLTNPSRTPLPFPGC